MRKTPYGDLAPPLEKTIKDTDVKQMFGTFEVHNDAELPKNGQDLSF